MKYFLAYYIVSGIIMSIVSYVNRKKHAAAMPEIETVQLDLRILFNFLVGFIQFPFWIPLEMWGIYLRNQNNKLKRKLEMKEKENEALQTILDEKKSSG